MSISMVNDQFTRIGLFIDGWYFACVSEYYGACHPRRSRISFAGLQRFVLAQAAKAEGVDVKYCRLLDSHYFRGRYPTSSVEPSRLLSERRFDENLIRTGITAHYNFMSGPIAKETGIDVWLALEAYEQTIHKRLDVVVLLAGDGDYAPLARKLNDLGARIMLLVWNFECEVQNNQKGIKETYSARTSSALLKEVSYAIPMQTLIDNPDEAETDLVNGLFVPPREAGSDSAVDGETSRVLAKIVESTSKHSNHETSKAMAQTVESASKPGNEETGKVLTKTVEGASKPSNRETGKVCFVDNDRMYGLIQRNNGRKTIFFPHCFDEGCFAQATNGSEVEFEVVMDPGFERPRAAKIRFLVQKQG